MTTLKLHAQTDANGILKLEVSTGLAGQEVEVVLTVQAQGQSSEKQAVDALGWPIGFFERTYGALADDPIDRPPQLPLEERDFSFEE